MVGAASMLRSSMRLFVGMVIVWIHCFLPAVVAYYESTTQTGPEALQAGQALFAEREYEDAAIELWKAVLWHGQTPPSQQYDVQAVFTQFLQCYMLQDKLVDGLAFVALESFRRGQEDMGHRYLEQALSVDPNHEQALLIQQEFVNGRATPKRGRIVDDSDGTHQKDDEASLGSDNPNDLLKMNPDLANETPESLYERGSQHFSDKNYEECADFFEISCLLSGEILGPSCANAVYCRTMILDWGYNGTGFDRDMERIRDLTKAEVVERRWPISVSEQSTEPNAFSWRRATSVHPHMMLGYPVAALLKRYVAESVAYMDEKMARIAHRPTAKDLTEIPPLPDHMPFSIDSYRSTYQQEFADHPGTPIRVGFVGSGFNSKAVLYLSHDMFRFFDDTRFEIHVFSFGPPDNPLFIQHGMRGVDWRERVKANLCEGCFHDLQRMQYNHIESAQYIHDQHIHILIEWDGYARQGERAQGLFALRPAPIQILHQEYLGTSGALYVDYIVSDPIASPPHLQHLYTEKIIYMPNHFFSKGHAYQKEVLPPTHDYLPAKTPYELGTGSPQENKCMAAASKGYNTSAPNPSFVFCNFNKFLKNNPGTLRSWLRILQEVPNSFLCLLENPKEGVPYFRKFVHEAAATMTGTKQNVMIPGDGDELNSRIYFLPWQRNPFDHQRRNQDFCNAMLDSFPYNGHTVAQDSLYAGVPVVTRSDGDDMCSRVTTSSNVVLGLSEHLNAKNVSDYEQLAIRLATDPNLYKEVRRTLIDTALQRNPMHPYWDVARYVKNFETGLHMAWHRFLDGQDPDHLFVKETEAAATGTMDEEILAHPAEGGQKRQRKISVLELRDEL